LFKVIPPTHVILDVLVHYSIKSDRHKYQLICTDGMSDVRFFHWYSRITAVLLWYLQLG